MASAFTRDTFCTHEHLQKALDFDVKLEPWRAVRANLHMILIFQLRFVYSVQPH